VTTIIGIASNCLLSPNWNSRSWKWVKLKQ